MPSIMTHYYQLNMLFDKLDGSVKSIVSHHKDEFMQGGQGADLLFSLFYDKTDYVRWGSEFHARLVKESFEAMAEFAKNDSSGRALCYGLGMIAHYCMDRIIHPYVDFMVREVVPQFCDPFYNPQTMHLRFEACLDTFILQKTGDGRVFYAGKYLPFNRKMTEMLEELYSKKLAPLFGYELPEGRIIKACREYKNFANLTSSYTGMKYRFINFVEPLFTQRKLLASYFRPIKLYPELDCGNENRRKFPTVIGEESKTEETVFEMIDRSISEALDLCGQFFRLVSEGTPFEYNFDINYAGMRTKNN